MAIKDRGNNLVHINHTYLVFPSSKFCSLFLNDWSSWEWYALAACEFIKHITNANIECFSKNTIPSVQMGNNLCVTSRNIEQNRVLTTTLLSSNFDVRYAVIDADQWYIKPA